MREILWKVALIVGLIVFLPSQMSVVDDVARRWTDIVWSSSQRVRDRFQSGQASRIYYFIVFGYVIWTFIIAAVFLQLGDGPKLMVTVIANFNNVALGVTAFHLLWINRTLLPAPLRPNWFQQIGVVCCGLFYLGLAALVFYVKILSQLF